jgi:glycine cleavage system H protein
MPGSETRGALTMATPAECRFTESHEWIDLDGDIVTLGLTQYAADELTDVTYVEMRAVKTTILPGDSVGEVESVKTTSDVYCPVGGEIIEVNQAAIDEPSLLNTDPFGAAWLVKVRTADPSPLDGLMDHETYANRFPLKQ